MTNSPQPTTNVSKTTKKKKKSKASHKVKVGNVPAVTATTAPATVPLPTVSPTGHTPAPGTVARATQNNPNVKSREITVTRKKHPSEGRYPGRANQELGSALTKLISLLEPAERDQILTRTLVIDEEGTAADFDAILPGDRVGIALDYESEGWVSTNFTIDKVENDILYGKDVYTEEDLEVTFEEASFARAMGYFEILYRDGKPYGVDNEQKVKVYWEEEPATEPAAAPEKTIDEQAAEAVAKSGAKDPKAIAALMKIKKKELLEIQKRQQAAAKVAAAKGKGKKTKTAAPAPAAPVAAPKKKKKKKSQANNSPIVINAPAGEIAKICQDRDEQVTDELVKALTNPAMSGVVPPEFLTGMLLESVVQAAKQLVGSELTIAEDPTNTFVDLARDRAHFVKTYGAAQAALGANFATEWAKHVAEANQVARSNLGTTGVLYSYVLPAFNADGSHAPLGAKDFPWAQYPKTAAAIAAGKVVV